ncbi:MAG: hypothetical protein CFE45_42280 [Burkholderiales bacterium PBB5]|nr:MAG: hypothetical protein CFE45_42280 [Burkholderiales bacterium PBB5]
MSRINRQRGLGTLAAAAPLRRVAIVQARMGSTRFPGKMLAPLGGRPLLEWVLRRVQSARLVDAVVLATTDLQRDKPLVDLARNLGVATFTGSESDVLGRFAAASAQHRADVVVRVCADNPFVDGAEIDRLLAFFAVQDVDYAWDHASAYRLAAVPAPAALAFPDLRFDVDRPEHLSELALLCERAGLGLSSTAAEVVAAARASASAELTV